MLSILLTNYTPEKDEKALQIIEENQSQENVYVQSLLVNDKEINFHL